jgi:hypothetical protein
VGRCPPCSACSCATRRRHAPHAASNPPHAYSCFAACCSGGRQSPYQQRSTARAVLLRSREQASSCVALQYSSSPAVWLMHACSAFSSPDIAAVGEVGAVRRSAVHQGWLLLSYGKPRRFATLWTPCACPPPPTSTSALQCPSLQTCSCHFSSTVRPNCCKSAPPSPTLSGRSR